MDLAPLSYTDGMASLLSRSGSGSSGAGGSSGGSGVITSGPVYSGLSGSSAGYGIGSSVEESSEVADGNDEV